MWQQLNMAIQFVNSTTAVQNSNSTTITINVPSGVANGQVLVLIATVGSVSSTWTTPTGWTLWSAANAGRTVYYKIASSEPASYTITQSVSTTASATILAYANAAIDVMGTLGTNATPSVAPSITTTANNCYVFYYSATRTVASVTYTTPTGYNALVSDSDATAPSYVVFYTTQATAGATGTVSSTPSGGNTSAPLLFSLKPTVTGKFFFMMGA